MLKSFYKKAKKLDPSSVVRPDEVFGKMGQRLGGSVVKKAMKKAMSK
jgi:hypothetical protein